MGMVSPVQEVGFFWSCREYYTHDNITIASDGTDTDSLVKSFMSPLQ
jgi:hypothetical protein